MTDVITGTVVPAGCWLEVETNIGVVCACLPTMRSLINIGLPALRSRLSKSLSKFSKGSSNNSSNYAPKPNHQTGREVRVGVVESDVSGRADNKQSQAWGIPTITTEWTIESEVLSKRDHDDPV